jgi:hypothetical protein
MFLDVIQDIGRLIAHCNAVLVSHGPSKSLLIIMLLPDAAERTLHPPIFSHENTIRSDIYDCSNRSPVGTNDDNVTPVYGAHRV